jgi:DNA-binding beta-propeller fold protein YncE
MKLNARIISGFVALSLTGLSFASAIPAAAVVGPQTSTFVVEDDAQFSAVSPDKSLMVLSYEGADEVWFLNTATGAATIVADPNEDIADPGQVVFTSDGSTIYLANYASGSGNIVEIDVATAAVVDTLSAAEISGPWTLAISPDNSTLYIGDYSDDTLVTYDIANDTADSVDSHNYPYQMHISTDGSTVYSIDYYGDIDVFNTSTGLVTQTWTSLSVISDFAMYGSCTNSSMSVFYVVDSGNDALYAVSSADGTIISQNTSDITSGSIYCAVSPDNSSVFVTNYDIGNTGVDLIATEPGEVAEFRASDLAFVKNYSFPYVAYTEQMQFFNNCTAWVTGYYGYGQTLTLDTVSCGGLADTGASASTNVALVSSGAALVALGALALWFLRRRTATV